MSRAPPWGGAEVTFGKNTLKEKKMLPLLGLIFDQKRELNCVFYAYQKYLILFGKRALPRASPTKKLNHVFLSVNLRTMISDQKGNEITYLRPIKYKISF